MNDFAKRIIRKLDKVLASGRQPYEIFEDWLDMVHSCLSTMPAHLRSAMQTQTLAEDEPDVKVIFDRLQDRYKAYCWDAFAEALAILLDSTDGGDDVIAWDDTIGQVYMEWGMPNKHTGQFFTPYSLAQVCANLTMQTIEDEIYEHLTDAYLQSPEGIFHNLMWPERVGPFVRKMGADILTFCAAHYKPVTVNDCACGSGVMLLAAAEMTPRWARDWGLVNYSGQDIDMTCVKMCQVNMMLYGLNGFHLKLAYEMAMAQQSLEVSVELNNYKQVSLF